MAEQKKHQKNVPETHANSLFHFSVLVFNFSKEEEEEEKTDNSKERKISLIFFSWLLVESIGWVCVFVCDLFLMRPHANILCLSSTAPPSTYVSSSAVSVSRFHMYKCIGFVRISADIYAMQ